MEDIIKKEYQRTIEMLGDTVEQKNSRIKELEKQNEELKFSLQCEATDRHELQEQNKQLLEVVIQAKDLIGNSFAAIEGVNPTELRTVYNALWNVIIENTAEQILKQ